MKSHKEPAQGRLLIISNRLPVHIEQRDGDFTLHPSVGGVATSLTSLRAERDLLWIGWPGIDLSQGFEQLEGHLINDFDCIPLSIPQPQFQKYYDGMSNGCLWPLFHYFSQYAHFDLEEWEAYEQVNQLFCDKVLEIAHPEDQIWVHDYHLMLLPKMIRDAIPHITIGFFLHIPFPSYEIFRMLPWRDKILEGLLGADLVGFHCYSYARHFLSASLRILGLEHDFGRVSVDEHISRVDTFPLGVDVNRFAAAANNPSIQEKLNALKHKTGDRKVVLSVDRLDFTKGILHRLRTFERFLDDHEDWQGRVTLISLCVPSRTRVPEYQTLKREVDEQVGRINGKFGQPGWVPIWYLYRALPFDELVPLYQLAEVALVTPLRDGMNLVAKEYLACRPDETGVLVLSETAGAAEELGEAIVINPFDEQAMVAALHQALTMPINEQKERNHPMIARLKRYDVDRWADDFLSQLAASPEEQSATPCEVLNAERRSELLKAFSQSTRRLLLLDYDGTLVPIVSQPADAKPDDELLALLQALSAQPNTTVVIVSGRDQPTLAKWLETSGANLVAEHGMHTFLTDTKQWETASEAMPEGWKDHIRPLLEMFVDRTPGSTLEEKSAALAWHYRNAEPEMGSLRAKELFETLEGLVANTTLGVLSGRKIIEIKHGTITKGHAINRWLLKPAPDFILAIGDDLTDEDMFQALPEHAWTIKVGRARQSAATYMLSSPRAVRRLLQSMKDC